MQYRTVFDLTAAASLASVRFPTWELLAIAGVGVLVAALSVLPGPWAIRRGSQAYAGAFLACALGFSAIVAVASYLAADSKNAGLLQAVRSGNAMVAEGRVNDFTPMPSSGHKMEKFCVAGTCFEYSDYVVNGGFNNTSSHGGPIRLGLPVRVTYVIDTIVKLEVAQ